MGLVSKPYTFSAGASIIASEHNSNFDTIYNSHNGNISNSNISNSAAIAYSKLSLAGSILNADIHASAAIAKSKLSLTGAIVNADINSSAAIVDTKLAQISTAGKVSGASLTSLASIPSGAGIIPVANLPALGLSFVSATTFAGEETKTISGLTTGVPYFIILDLVSASGNADLQLYPNGTLSTISATSGYDSSGNRLRLSSGSFGNGSICSLKIDIRTIQGDTTKTIVLVRGWHSVDGSVNAYGVLDSDADLSSITIGSATIMTLTGTAYLYKYATS